MRLHDNAQDVEPNRVDPCDHQVTFYEDDQALVDTTVTFLADGLHAGAPAIAVATADHLAAMEAALSRLAADFPHELGDVFVGIDAHEMLDRIMVDGRPDATAFDATINEVLDRFAQHPQAHVFGEMVSVLWERGNVTAALELEDLWNELARSRSFRLSCAYPIGVFQPDHSDAFQSVCRKHSSVAPTESFTRLQPDDQSRHVAELQQRVAAGDAEREHLRHQRQELESSLWQLQQLEQLRTEFVAMVVHDLQSPVGVISATLELLQDVRMTDEETQQLLDGATQGTRRVQRLVDDLLLSLQLESGEFTFELRPGDLSAALARATSDVQASTGRGLELQLPFDLPKVLIDEDRQVQILTNLLSNAVKFSPAGTGVQVIVEDRDEQVVVHVANQGEPIPAEDQGRLFQPFSRLRPATPGTGLGLYIARELVRGQGGDIWVVSDEEGTTFSYSVLKASAEG